MEIGKFEINTEKHCELIDITSDVKKCLKDVKDGYVIVYVPHTTSGITINENGDPDVVRDILAHLEKLVPENDNFKHFEGNSDAHIKSSLMGSSVTVLIQNSNLVLGTWQSIYYCEFDGPRNSRKFYVKVVKA